MASIGDLVSQLESARNEMDESKTSLGLAGQLAENLAVQAEGMDLEDVSVILRALHAQIGKAGERVAVLGDGVDGLIVTAESLRKGSDVSARAAVQRVEAAEDASTPVSPKPDTERFPSSPVTGVTARVVMSGKWWSGSRGHRSPRLPQIPA
jgi:hypothetical protein